MARTMIAVAKASGGLPEIGFRQIETRAKQKPKDPGYQLLGK